MVRSVDDVANRSPAGANEMSLMTYVSEPRINRPFPRVDSRRAESDQQRSLQGPAARPRLSCRPHATHVSVCVRTSLWPRNEQSLRFFLTLHACRVAVGTRLYGPLRYAAAMFRFAGSVPGLRLR